MKTIVLGASLSAVLLLAACGEESASEPKTEVKADEKKEATTAPEKEVKKEVEQEEAEVQKSDAGVKTPYFTNKDLGIAEKLGPINLEINKVQTSRFAVAEDFKESFKNKDEVTMIILNIKAENTSDKTVSVYPDQATITTNTGEQLQAETFISDQVGGEFIGKVKKEGNVMFLADSKPEDITSIKFILDGPHDENLEKLAERYTVEIPTKK